MGVPVMVGPNHWDFAQITQMLADAGGLRIVSSGQELAENLIQYFKQPVLCQQAAKAGLAVVEANRGALQRQFALAELLLTRQTA